MTDLERSLEQADRLALAAHEAALSFADATQADVDRVTQIVEARNVPIALHGGSGLSAE